MQSQMEPAAIQYVSQRVSSRAAVEFLSSARSLAPLAFLAMPSGDAAARTLSKTGKTTPTIA